MLSNIRIGSFMEPTRFGGFGMRRDNFPVGDLDARYENPSSIRSKKTSWTAGAITPLFICQCAVPGLRWKHAKSVGHATLTQEIHAFRYMWFYVCIYIYICGVYSDSALAAHHLFVVKHIKTKPSILAQSIEDRGANFFHPPSATQNMSLLALEMNLETWW